MIVIKLKIMDPDSAGSDKIEKGKRETRSQNQLTLAR